MVEISPHHMALAGLLHDIDKFMRLASVKSPAHITSFIQAVVPERFYRPFIGAMAHLNHPNDKVSRCLALADKLATGNAQASGGNKPVVSVFSGLGDGKKQVRHIPIRPLSLSKEALFPTDKQATQDAYQQLWHAFWHEAQNVGKFQKSDIHIYIEALQSLLHRYLWCVPSGYADSDDISLYDHSRVVASLASCLSGYDDETLSHLEKSNQPVATFIEGDISGVQKFLYSVPMRGATKQLRARSLYLQLLTEIVARYILRELNMPITNLIYVGGGHFYLLAPHGVDVAQLRQRLDAILLKHHDGELYLALGATELRMQDFVSHQFHKKWHDLKQETGKAKSQRYGMLPDKSILFKPRPQDGDDELSLRYLDRDERVDDDENDTSNEPKVFSAFGTSLEAFAQKLKHADAIVLGYTRPQQQPIGAFQAVFAELGFDVDLIYTKYIKKHEETYYPTMAELDYAIVQGIKDVPSEKTIEAISRQLGCPVLPSLRYVVNVTPMVGDDNYRPVEFDELAEASEGIHYIGVLRMDVDDLGKLFAAGFKKPNGESRASLARVASLSNALSLYFEGWVGKICREVNQQYRKQIDDSKPNGRKIDVEAVYAVYSGGDDLFIVGRWDVLPEVAQRIHDEFSDYACHNERVHISAGITLHKGKYPLYLAAEDADNALKSAKDIDEHKNAISFLGQPVKWDDGDDHWQAILDIRNELIDLVQGEKVSRSLIQMILHFYGQYQEADREYGINKSGKKQLVWGAWMWRSAYQFTRFAERLHDDRLKARVMALHQRLIADMSQENALARNIQLMGIASRWADALTRSQKEE